MNCAHERGKLTLDLDTLRGRIGGIAKDTPIRVYCRVGQRGYLAEQLLKAHGFTHVKNIAGGWCAIWGDLREDYLVGQEPEE
jgi:rhodanese-related sulfurtransferase